MGGPWPPADQATASGVAPGKGDGEFTYQTVRGCFTNMGRCHAPGPQPRTWGRVGHQEEYDRTASGIVGER